MQSMLLEVVKCGDAFTVKSEKSENGELKKRQLVLKELGGKYESHYVVTALAEQAEKDFKAGDLVFATMRFQSREYNVCLPPCDSRAASTTDRFIKTS